MPFKNESIKLVNLRLSILFILTCFSSMMAGQAIPKDWFEKDYQTDSVAGMNPANTKLAVGGETYTQHRCIHQLRGAR
jgi:hypothetical protein